MRRAANPNIEIIELAVARLGALADEMVFLGGCATGLLITDPLAPPIRATNDVDVISEVASLIEYQRLSKRLRAQGFSEDQSSDAPICRWQAQGVVLDVMPTSPEILGFGNPWYQPAFTVAGQMTLPSGRKIRMVSAPYFLATKLAAFEGRGQGDWMASPLSPPPCSFGGGGVSTPRRRARARGQRRVDTQGREGRWARWAGSSALCT
jgi:hypothetical protein